MAISIFQQPTLNSATEFKAYAIHWRKHFVWGVKQSSNISSFYKHRFVLRVYLGASATGLLVASIKQPWNGYETSAGVNRRAFFDIRDILATYLFWTIYDWNVDFPNQRPIHFVGCTDNDPVKPISLSRYGMRKFEVEAWEEYAATPTGTPSEPAGTPPDFEFNAVNATYGTLPNTPIADNSMESNSWNEAFYLGSSSGRLMTDVPIGGQVSQLYDLSDIASGGWDFRGNTERKVQFVAPYDAMTMTLYNNTDVDFIRISVHFKSTGYVSYTIANTTANGGDPTPSNDSERVLHFGVGPKNLAEQTDSATLATAMSGTDWVYYKVRITNSSVDSISESYYFVRDEYSHAYQCLNGNQSTDTSKNNRIRLAWINSCGAWDYFTFACKKTEEITAKNKVLKHEPAGTWNTEFYDENPLQTTTSVQGMEVKKILTLNTGYISEEEGEWLQWLFKSPLVHYIRKNTGETTIPAQIVETKMKKQTLLNDGCKIQYTIKIEFSSADKTTVR